MRVMEPASFLFGFKSVCADAFQERYGGLAWMAWPPPHIRVEQDMQRKQADPFYLSKAWRTVRAEALRRDHGMCVRCMERFMNGGEKPRLAVMVHHKNPERNIQSLSLILTTWKACVTSAIIASILKRERKSPKQVYRISAKAYESSTFERVRA